MLNIGSTISNEVAQLAEVAYQTSLGSESLTPSPKRTAAMRAAIEIAWSQILEEKLSTLGMVFFATLDMIPENRRDTGYVHATQALINLMHDK